MQGLPATKSKQRGGVQRGGSLVLMVGLLLPATIDACGAAVDTDEVLLGEN